MIKNYSHFLFESTNEDFAKSFNNNLSLAFENLISLIDLTPEKSAEGSEEYERRKKEMSQKRFTDKITFYQNLSKFDNLKKAMEYAVTQGNKYYNAIKVKLDPTQTLRAETEAERKARDISMPGMDYNPGTVAREILDREPIAKYFVEGLNVLLDIAEELEKPAYQELGNTLLKSFKEYFGELGSQKIQEREDYLFEAKKINYLNLFGELKTVVETYKTRLMNMIGTINSITKGVDPGSPLMAYQSFVETLWDYYDWLNNPANFNLGGLSPEEQGKKVIQLQDKVQEVTDFLAKASAPGGKFASFVELANKPVSLGLGQFDTMLNKASDLISQGIEKVANLQSIVTNMWKSVRMFKGFSAADIGTSLDDILNTVTGAKAQSLVSSLEKKKGKSGKTTAKAKLSKEKFTKINSSDISTDNEDQFARALSPLTDYRKDLDRLGNDERSFTITTRVLGNEKGLPNLADFEERFQNYPQN